MSTWTSTLPRFVPSASEVATILIVPWSTRAFVGLWIVTWTDALLTALPKLNGSEPGANVNCQSPGWPAKSTVSATFPVFRTTIVYETEPPAAIVRRCERIAQRPGQAESWGKGQVAAEHRGVGHGDPGEEHSASEQSRGVDVVRARCQGDGIRTARVRGGLRRDRAAAPPSEGDAGVDAEAGEARGAGDGRVVERPRDGQVQPNGGLTRGDGRGPREGIAIEPGHAGIRRIV